MIDFNQEVRDLQNKGHLPHKDYFSQLNMPYTPYNNIQEFGQGLSKPIYLAIGNGVKTLEYAFRTIWAVTRAVGNALIGQRHDAFDALQDAGKNLTLTLALGIMAPIHALTASLEVLTRIISSWYAKEPIEGLTRYNFSEQLTEEIGQYDEDIVDICLPSSNYFKRERFVKPINDYSSFFASVVNPIAQLLVCGAFSLYHALHAVKAAIHLIANLVIAKPRHAGESVRDIGVHASLALSFAVMAPINAVVEAIACVTRIISTWHPLPETVENGREAPKLYSNFISEDDISNNHEIIRDDSDDEAPNNAKRQFFGSSFPR